jgi:hypothetical protein
MQMWARNSLLSVAIAFGVEALVLSCAFQFGRLSGLLPWDDCEIFLRGLQNLQSLAQSYSLFDYVRHGNMEIHAALSDVQTVIGIALSGGRVWGPYLLNAIWLALALAAVLSTMEGRHISAKLALILFILFQPLTIHALTYIKSDTKGGLLIAAGLFVLAKGHLAGDKHRKRLGASLMSLSILSKLTAFYLPVVAIAVLWLLEFRDEIFSAFARLKPARALGQSQPEPLAPLSRDLAELLRLTVIISAPFAAFFLFNLRSLLEYIHDALSYETTGDGLTTLQRIQFYGPHLDGSGLWGNLLLYIVLFGGAAAVLAVRRNNVAFQRALVALFAGGALFFLPLVLAKTSNDDHDHSAPFHRLRRRLCRTLWKLDGVGCRCTDCHVHGFADRQHRDHVPLCFASHDRGHYSCRAAPICQDLRSDYRNDFG